MNADLWISIGFLVVVFVLTVGRDYLIAKRQLDLHRRLNR